MPRLKTSTDTYYIEITTTTCPYCGYESTYDGDKEGCKVKCNTEACLKNFWVGREE